MHSGKKESDKNEQQERDEQRHALETGQILDFNDDKIKERCK